MASTYTPLGVELMATGENAGTWGTKTNTNLSLFEQITGGYKVQTLNTAGSGANTTALAVLDGSTGATLATRVIVLGAESAEAITGNKIVTILFPVIDPVNSITLCCAVPVKAPSSTSKAVVPAPPAIDTVAKPPVNCSIRFKLLLVFVPHVPAFSPVAISSTPRGV